MVTVAVCGAGDRGLDAYAGYLLRNPSRARVVAVAEPRGERRAEAARRHGLDQAHLFDDWRAMAAGPRLADAVIVATQDQDHVEPSLAFLNAGYAVLLEKPMATDEAGCRAIAEAARGSVFGICHVLRFAPYFRELRRVVEGGVLGELATLRHFEPVNFWHFAHSYVRGNWRREDLSSSFILAKSCHDMDIMLYLTGRRCLRLASFGGLTHFRSENRPAGAADRCLDCAVEAECPYSAPRFYLHSGPGWPVDVITHDASREGILAALRQGPYGRCVYACDNDVADHQVVSLEFEGGLSATFTATAFTDHRVRETELLGSHGSVQGNGSRLRVTDFRTRTVEEWEVAMTDEHLGGDEGLMEAFLEAVEAGRPELLSSPEEALASHLMAFAAERSRRRGTVETLQ